MKEKYWERLRTINRSYEEFKVHLFGLKPNFNILTDNQIPLDVDVNYVQSIIKRDYPEHVIAINYSSDLLDNFHPLSKNAYAFMAIHLKALKNKEDKDTLMIKYVSEINRRSQMYVVHE